MSDLSEFDGLSQSQEEGLEIPIYHPKTGEELGITVKVAGPESARQKKFRNALMNDRLIRNRNRRVTVAEIEQDALKLTVASIISWEGVIIDTKPVEFTKENAEMVLSKYPFLRDQIDAAVNDRALFIKS